MNTVRTLPPRRGSFIVFEGGDGAGKGTQIEMLVTWLRGNGHDVLVTREPGATPLGARLREILLHGEENDARAETLLFAADRAQHVSQVIAPALSAGTTVVCDRYIDSSLAYQGANHVAEAELEMIARISDWAARGLVPDLTVLLDIDAAEGLARVRGRATADTMESRTLEYHQRVAQRFRDLAAAAPWRYVVVDAAADAKLQAAVIRHVVGDRLYRATFGASVEHAAQKVMVG